MIDPRPRTNRLDFRTDQGLDIQNHFASSAYGCSGWSNKSADVQEVANCQAIDRGHSSYKFYKLQPFLVARSSVARVWRPLSFIDSTFLSFFSRHTFSDIEKPTSRNFSTRRDLVFNRTFAIPISSKCPLKRKGPKNPKLAPFFVPSRRQLAP